MGEIERKKIIDEKQHQLNIFQNKNETELKENESKMYLEQQTNSIENERRQELLRNQYSFEERFIEQQMEALNEENLLQMMAIEMMNKNRMNNANQN